MMIKLVRGSTSGCFPALFASVLGLSWSSVCAVRAALGRLFLGQVINLFERFTFIDYFACVVQLKMRTKRFLNLFLDVRQVVSYHMLNFGG